MVGAFETQRGARNKAFAFSTAHLDHRRQVITTNCHQNAPGQYLPNCARCGDSQMVAVSMWLSSNKGGLCGLWCVPFSTAARSGYHTHIAALTAAPHAHFIQRDEGAAWLQSILPSSLRHSQPIQSNSGLFRHLTGTGTAAVRPKCRKSRQMHVKIVFYK